MTHEELLEKSKPVFDLIDKGVIKVFFEKGFAWSKYSEGSHGNKKLTEEDIQKCYQEQWGKLYKDNPEYIAEPEAHKLIMQVIENNNELDRKNKVESGGIFYTERDFVEKHWDNKKIQVSDTGIWSQEVDGQTCDYSQSLFLSYLREQLQLSNKAIPKDERGRPMLPPLSADVIPSVLVNILHEKTTARIIDLRGLLEKRAIGFEIDQAISWLLSVYFIDPTPANIAAFKHLLWMIKRKIWGRDIPSPLFFCFHSKKQHVGKTTLIRKLCTSFDWVYSGKGNLTHLLSANDYKAMVRGKYLLDFQELAIGSKIRGKNGESVDASVIAELKSAISSDVIEGRMMYGESNSTERQTAVFTSSTNIHIFDVCNDPTGMRRYWEFHLNPPENYDQEFYLKANEFFDNIVSIYQSIDENDDKGFFYPGAPEWQAMRAIQDSYAKQDTFTLFLKMKLWDISKDPEPGFERTTLNALLKTFNRFLIERGEREWRSGHLLNLLAQSRDIVPEVTNDEKTGKLVEYFWIKKP